MLFIAKSYPLFLFVIHFSFLFFFLMFLIRQQFLFIPLTFIKCNIVTPRVYTKLVCIVLFCGTHLRTFAQPQLQHKLNLSATCLSRLHQSSGSTTRARLHREGAAAFTWQDKNKGKLFSFPFLLFFTNCGR